MSSAEFASAVVSGIAAGLLIWRARVDRTSWAAGPNWHSKRSEFSSLTAEDLLVITDFDATITTGDSEQCHDLMGSSPLLTAGFRAEFAPLLDWTTNASIDGVEWWDKAHELMIKHQQPPRPLIPRLVRSSNMVPRPGALEMLRKLEILNVPVLIVSAGLSDVIEEFLRQHGVLSENVTVCSNRLNYAADSTPKSVCPDPPITSFTKQYAYSSASTFFRNHAHRRSVLQLGDSLTDVDPAKNVPHDHLLSIGFLNARPDPKPHSETFDAVVHGNRGSLAPVAELLEDIAPHTATTLIRNLSSSTSLVRLAASGSAISLPLLLGTYGAVAAAEA